MIKNIQNMNESSRKMWLVFLTIISMILVILLWSFYLKITVASATQPSNYPGRSGLGILQIFSTGFSVISGKTVSGLANSYVYFDEKFKTKNQFSISRGGQNFIYDELENLPVRDLP